MEQFYFRFEKNEASSSCRFCLVYEEVLSSLGYTQNLTVFRPISWLWQFVFNTVFKLGYFHFYCILYTVIFYFTALVPWPLCGLLASQPLARALGFPLRSKQERMLLMVLRRRYQLFAVIG